MKRVMKLVCMMLVACWCGTIVSAQTASIDADESGYTNKYDEVYLTARNAATAGAAVFNGATQTFVGQELDTVSKIWRVFMKYTLPEMTTVEACSLCFDGGTDASTTDFKLLVVSAKAYLPSGAADDYTHFSGWASSGAYSGIVRLNNVWDTSSFSSGINKVIFNQAGLDTLLAYSGTTIGLAVISSRDSSVTAPSSKEYIGFEYGTTPYLSLTYASGYSGTVSRTTDPSAIMRIDKANIEQVGR